MSSELNDDARALIRDALAAELPAGDARRKALKRAVLMRAAALGGEAAAAAAALPPIAGGGGVPGGGAALPGAGGALPGAGAIGGLLAKGAAVGILVAGAVHGVAHFGRQSRATPPVPSASYAPARVGTPEQRPVALPPATAATAEAPAALAALPSLAASSTPGTPSGALPGTSPRPGAAPTDAAPSLRAELELMSAVQAALRDGRPARALELIDRHAALYPGGQLKNERLAAEAVAACQSGDQARGRRAAETFLRHDSTSAMAERVRSACPTSGSGRRP